MPSATPGGRPRTPRDRAPRKVVPRAQAAKAATPEPTNEVHPPTTERRVLGFFAGGGLGALCASSAAQALDLIPLHLQHEINGSLATFAGIGLLYLGRRFLLPNRVIVEWDKK